MPIVKWLACLALYLFIAPIVCADGITKIVTAVEPPTNYYSKDGQFTGPSTEIVEEIKRKLNLDVEISVLPWARAYAYAKKGPNVVIFTAGKSQDRIEHGFHFIGPISTRNHVLFKKKGTSYSIHRLEDVKKQNLIVGSMRGDWRAKMLKEQGIEVDEVTFQLQNVRKLMAGRIDFWVSSDLDAPFILKNTEFNINDIEIAFFIKKGAGYIMLSQDTSREIVKRWRNAYWEMQKTGFFKKTAKKWSELLEINLGYAVDKGFYLIP